MVSELDALVFDEAWAKDVKLHDPSPPSTLRMVFSGDKLCGTILDNLDGTFGIIRRMGEQPRVINDAMDAVWSLVEGPWLNEIARAYRNAKARRAGATEDEKS